MRAPLRLARSICSARRSRVFLLGAAVAMSVVLVTSIACVTASLNAAFRAQIDTQIGTAEARLLPVSGETFDAELLETASKWEGVEQSVPRLQATLSLVTKQFAKAFKGYKLVTAPTETKVSGLVAAMFLVSPRSLARSYSSALEPSYSQRSFQSPSRTARSGKSLTP